MSRGFPAAPLRAKPPLWVGLSPSPTRAIRPLSEHREAEKDAKWAFAQLFAYVIDVGKRPDERFEANSTTRFVEPTILSGDTRSARSGQLITDCGPILIVGRRRRLPAFASRLFERAGFPTEQAVNGDEAMAAARRGASVPRAARRPPSGRERLRDRRASSEMSSATTFRSSSFPETERSRSTGRQACFVGGDDYVVKPADPDELLARAGG